MYASLAVRRTGTSDYRVRVRAMPTSTSLTLFRVVNGTLTSLGVVTVPGLVYSPGDTLRMQLRAVGSATTTLQAKVWRVGAPEPAVGSSRRTTRRPACRDRVASASSRTSPDGRREPAARGHLGQPRGHRALGGSLTTVVVGILTYLRPDGLRSTLSAVLPQAVEVGDATVLVIDNDPDAERHGPGGRVPDRSGADRARAHPGDRRGPEPRPRRERAAPTSSCSSTTTSCQTRAGCGRCSTTWRRTNAAAVAGPGDLDLRGGARALCHRGPLLRPPPAARPTPT